MEKELWVVEEFANISKVLSDFCYFRF